MDVKFSYAYQIKSDKLNKPGYWNQESQWEYNVAAYRWPVSVDGLASSRKHILYNVHAKHLMAAFLFEIRLTILEKCMVPLLPISFVDSNFSTVYGPNLAN